MKTALFVLFGLYVLLIAYLTIHFFIIDRDNIKNLKLYEEENDEQNKQIMILRQRLKYLDKALNEHIEEGENDDRKNKKSNRIIKRS